MRNGSQLSITLWAALAALLIPAPARAAVYELASEWMTISFQDGGKDMLLFTHLPDSDIFLHMKDYVTDASSAAPRVEVSVPLQQLVRADEGAGSGAAEGSQKSLVLTSRATPYKMLIQLDLEHRRYVISRPPDFTAFDSTTSATILSVFGVKTGHPENFLVMVQPEQPASPAPGLGDIELAAVNSLEASERTALVGECGGEPGAAASLDCWRGKIGLLLSRHQAEVPGRDLSPFDQRYLQNRLSRKGYEQFQSLRSSADDGDKLSLASNWHQMILGRDIAANAAAAAKIRAPAPAVARITENSLNRPAVPSAADSAMRPASPVAPPVPTPARWEKIAVALLALAAVVAFLAFR